MSTGSPLRRSFGFATEKIADQKINSAEGERRLGNVIIYNYNKIIIILKGLQSDLKKVEDIFLYILNILNVS